MGETTTLAPLYASMARLQVTATGSFKTANYKICIHLKLLQYFIPKIHTTFRII
jgi:hypothetical protein